MNGPDAAPDEGMSYVATSGGMAEKISLQGLRHRTPGAELIGTEPDARSTARGPCTPSSSTTRIRCSITSILTSTPPPVWASLGKPESLLLPAPVRTPYPGNFPHTYFGFDPDVTYERGARSAWRATRARDIRITELSRAYRIELGTGWYTAARRVIHAPGSYLTYEPQWNSDVNSVFENVASGEVYDS